MFFSLPFLSICTFLVRWCCWGKDFPQSGHDMLLDSLPSFFSVCAFKVLFVRGFIITLFTDEQCLWLFLWFVCSHVIVVIGIIPTLIARQISHEKERLSWTLVWWMRRSTSIAKLFAHSVQRKSIWPKLSMITNLIQSNYDVSLFTFPETRISWKKVAHKKTKLSPKKVGGDEHKFVVGQFFGILGF